MSDTDNKGTTEAPNPFLPSPDDMQHWTSVIGRAQQMMLEYALGQANEGNVSAAALFDPAKWIDNPATKLWTEQSSKMWDQGVAFWTSLASIGQPITPDAPPEPAKDRRFTDPDWTANPVFAMIRQTYGLLAEQMLTTTRQLEGPDPVARAKMEFAAKAMADAMAPTNLALTNPEVIKRAVETRGDAVEASVFSDLANRSLQRATDDDAPRALCGRPSRSKAIVRVT